MPKRRDSKPPTRTSRPPTSSPTPPHTRSPKPAARARSGADGDVAADAAQPRAPEVVIAGIGASAGGLEAFSALLAALPDAPGLALVLVQHLAPHHESSLPSLLGATTEIPVVQAADGMKVEADHVYIIPPNVQMGIRDGVLHLLPRPTDDSQYVPVDFFLRSLADSAREGAIGVIMSGTASDGAVGIRDIKAVGGITLAQDPATAKFDGMPRAAIGTGMVDMVLPPDRLAAKLVDIARHPYLRSRAPKGDGAADGSAAIPDEQLQRMFKLLRTSTGVDFRHYKLPTIARRLHRRMVLHRITKIDEYLRYLQEHPGEVQALHQDLLIHVTRFFREPESFQALRDQVFPALIEQHNEQSIRIWIAGCSSGEEAYSVAISLLETLGERASAVPIQIFATDVSEHAIEQARNGLYPESIAVDVSPERLRRFFTNVDSGYRVTKMVRDMCIFARQDLTRDPPFSKLDLIVCRNVMIYMAPVLQTKLLSIFHYALKQRGYLMLGHAETIGTLSELFEIEDKRHRIYKKKLADAALPAMSFDADRLPQTTVPRRPAPAHADNLAQHEADRIALERYAPPGVIVDEDLQIVQFRGQTGLFLEPAPGDPSMSLLKMAREGLLHGVRTAFHGARKTGAPVRKDGLKIKQNGALRDVGVEVIPLAGAGRGNFLVLFHAGTPPGPLASSAVSAAAPARKRHRKDDDRVQQLESELAASREYLQSIIQEVEAANEELQSANEEILSSNEELQSTNEELDTAKEELQSTNEELNTLNEELHGRNAELSRANSDLVNLLGSIQIAIVIVANDLRIRRFTPMAERYLNLIASDIGRPISDIRPNIDCPDLDKTILEAIDSVTPQEREVQDHQGRWFALRVRPYKNVENRIDGAVLALFDIHAAKEQDRQLRRARSYSDAIFNAVPIPLAVLDDDFTVEQVNEAFCERFGYRRDAVAGRKLGEIDDGAWNVSSLHDHLSAAVSDGTRVDHFDLAVTLPRRGSKDLALSVCRIDGAADRVPSLLLTLAEKTTRG